MRQLAALLLCALFFAALVACSSDDKSVPTAEPTVQITAGPIAPALQPAPAQTLNAESIEPQDGVIEITASGQKFTQNFLRMPAANESITIRLTNNDNVPHSLRIAGLDGRFDTEDDAVANPVQIDGGGVGELTFAPQADGAYTFRCDFHPATMGGQIIVGSATPGSGPSSSVETPSPETSFPPEGETETPAP
jgi:plastocyanin